MAFVLMRRVVLGWRVLTLLMEILEVGFVLPMEVKLSKSLNSRIQIKVLMRVCWVAMMVGICSFVNQPFWAVNGLVVMVV